jgi:orotidine-5'-phosphate decarboxylase
MPAQIPTNRRLIVALDVPTQAQALELADRLAPQVGFFKVGLQLFLDAGFAVCDALSKRDHQVMLDLKFHDIPQTVALTTAQLANHDIALATVHGYPQVVAAAAKAKGKTKILAVTVLTSLGPEELAQSGFAGSLAELVRLRAETSLAAGADGIVCSPLETAFLRKAVGAKPVIATPGIRPLDSAADDQTRTATPKAALAAGADYIIIGRPITKAADPVAAAREILEEMG